MDRRQSLFEMLFVSAAILYFGFRIGLSDSIEKIEADVLRPIELAQSEGLRERAEQMAEEVLGAESVEVPAEGQRSLASIAEAATTVRLYPSPLLTESPHELAGDVARHVFRRRAVSPNIELLKGKIDSLKNEKLAELSDDYRALPLNLFADADYVGVIDAIEPSLKGGYLLRGRVQGERDSSMAMIFENGTLIADVAVGRDHYELRYMQDTHVAQQIDPSRVDVFANVDETQLIGEVLKQNSGVTSGHLPVSIVYSAPIKIAQGSRASVEGSLQLAAARANDQLAKAGSTIQIRLAAVSEGEVSKGAFQIMSASDTSANAKVSACGLELLQDEDPVWTAGDLAEVRWQSSHAASSVELILIFPDGSEQSLGATENDGQTHILVPKLADPQAEGEYRLRLQTPDGCAVESRSIRIH